MLKAPLNPNQPTNYPINHALLWEISLHIAVVSGCIKLEVQALTISQIIGFNEVPEFYNFKNTPCIYSTYHKLFVFEVPSISLSVIPKRG